MSVKIKDRGWNKIKHLALSKHVAVGILGSDANKGYPDSEATTVQVGTWNHYGTSNIPARPFISGTIDSHLPELRKLQARLLGGVTTLKLTEDHALALLGEQLRKLIVQKINDGFPPPNAESTKAKKKSSTPLIDTGQLKGSITYQVRS